MPESKIQLRAQILKEISRLKAIPAVCDKDIEQTIKALSGIEDKTFLCNTILKEINGNLEYFDGVLAILAQHLAKDVLEKCVFVFLERNDTPEEKKLFLLNFLNQAGFGVDPNLIHLYVKNADELIDLETEKFLQMAEVNPEAQIDFLDFYFGISPEDRNLLLDSIIRDYSGDMLANILTPLIYSLDDYETLKMCIDGLLKSKSYLAYAPLDWLIKSNSDERVASLARKTKNELKIAGLRKDVSIFEYYTELFKDSKPKNILVSSIDGSSDFSFIFSREYENGAISTFFTVFNLDLGPVSCFGLSNISQEEYKTVLARFFRDTEVIPLDFPFGKKLMDSLTDLALKNKKKVPYELLCWRQLTYDIPDLDGDIEEFMKSRMKVQKVNKLDLRRAVNSEYCARWFFSYTKRYRAFIDLLDEICELKEDEYEKFDLYTTDFMHSKKSIRLYESVKKRFLYQAYFMLFLGFNNLSTLFYSIYCSEEAMCEFFKFSIQKSVYEFFLNLQNMKDHTDKSNVFAKQRRVKYFDFNAELMIQLIEKKWIN